MKGMHITVNSWQPGRAEDGFKMTPKEIQKLESSLWGRIGLPCRREDKGRADHMVDMPERDGDCAPVTVLPVGRYIQDLECLTTLTSTLELPQQLYRATQQAAFYVLGDTSGKGKGNAVVDQYGIDYESGAWNLEWCQNSSNCREVENLADRLERLVLDRSLDDHEVFLITDNSSFKGAYYKGHSPSWHLSEIVFRVHKAERDGGFLLHVIHISGKRMKASGVDGLSHSDLMEGMMGGQDPLSFIPFDLGADERSNGLVSQWVCSWWTTEEGANFGGLELVEIRKDNMFELRDLKAARLWMLPPAAMEVAMELLYEDQLAHPQWPHVFVVPRLITHLWRKELMKSVDLLFTVPVSVPFWTARQFEHLIIVIILPLSYVPSYTGPWLVKGSEEGEHAEQALRRSFKGGEDPNDAGEFHELDGSLCQVWEDPTVGSWLVLQQFLAWAGTFPPVQKCLVRAVLSGDKQRYLPEAGRQRGRVKCLRPGS